MRRSVAFRLAALLVLVVGVSVAFTLPPVREVLAVHLTRLLEWVRGLGAWGPVALAGAYVVAAVLLVPGLLLSWGAGYLFGLGVGTAAASVGSTVGAAAAFGVGRTLARRLVEAKVAPNPQFRAIDHAVAEQGFKIVLLIRLAPVFPFNFMNYVFGLTKVRFRDYFLASWIGMFPATLLNVYIGTLIQSLTEISTGDAPGGPVRQVFFYVGLLVTVAVTVFITRFARAALARAAPGVADAAPSSSAPSA